MRDKLLPIFTLLLAMASIQYGASVAKNLFPIAGVAGASTLRLMVAAVALCAIFKPWKSVFSSGAKKDLFFYGASLGLMNLSFYFALAKIPLGIAVALEFTGPLAVAVLGGTRKLDFLWAVLAGIGIFLLLPMEGAETKLDPLGVFLALVAGLFWALYIVFGKRLGSQVKGPIAASAGMAIAAIIVAPWGLVLNASEMINLEALPMGIFVGLFSSAIPYSLEMSALKRIPSQTFSVLMSLEPAFASVIGLVFLGESLTNIQWLAIICVIVASQGSSFTPKIPLAKGKQKI
ncbi:MAG: EamA family transporter [Halobacteriovoraceae bacterium]|nr:EamA family transporter [Peredibacter sp.]MBJ01156.1 EamA family transporter [Halobacteriovoraceae bacterium]|tara:strand:+ start:574 stop:1443 length:870 start_codon:yes stop_codon:yes gene_type:complete